MYENELYHHGVLGMKWGVRRYQPYGSGGYNPKNKGKNVSEAAEYAKKIQKMEKKAVQRQYKKDRKNGGSYIFKPFRRGTGDNYNKAEEAFYKRMANDSTYRDLSKKAYDAEKKRLLAEKRYVDDDEEYSKYYSSENAQRLLKESMKATAAKEDYANKAVKFFTENELKDAKIKDLNITENIELAKKYLKTDKNIFYWDENLEYNPDSYYGDWVEKSRFK